MATNQVQILFHCDLYLYSIIIYNIPFWLLLCHILHMNICTFYFLYFLKKALFFMHVDLLLLLLSLFIIYFLFCNVTQMHVNCFEYRKMQDMPVCVCKLTRVWVCMSAQVCQSTHIPHTTNTREHSKLDNGEDSAPKNDSGTQEQLVDLPIALLNIFVWVWC